MSPRTPSALPRPCVKVVFPAPRSPVRITRSPDRSGRREPLRERLGRPPACSWSARARTASPSRGSRSRRPPPRTRGAPRSGSCRAARRGRRCGARRSRGVAASHRRPHEHRRHTRPSARGQYADPAQPERRADRLEDQRPDRAAVELARAARRTRRARRRRTPASRQRGGGRVERGPGAEGGVDHGEDVGGGLRADDPTRGPSRALVHWCSTGSCAGRLRELVEGGVDLLVALEDHHVAGALELEQG